jgi:hypothetical protein
LRGRGNPLVLRYPPNGTVNEAAKTILQCGGELKGCKDKPEGFDQISRQLPGLSHRLSKAVLIQLFDRKLAYQFLNGIFYRV